MTLSQYASRTQQPVDEATLAPLFGRVRGARAPMVAAMAAGGSR